MREYALITLNFIEYAGTYLKKLLDMLEFWMCLMQHIAQGRCTNYWVVTQTETYSEHSQTFKMERFAKRMRNERRCAAGHFSGQGRVCRTRALWWRFRQKQNPVNFPAGKYLQITLKIIFWMENLTQRWIQSGSFLPKSGHFFDFQKWQGRPPLFPLVVGLWM